MENLKNKKSISLFWIGRMSTVILSTLFFISSQAQIKGFKKLIDVYAEKNWPFIDGIMLSENGKYFVYKITDKLHNDNRLIVQSSDLKWKREITGNIQSLNFTGDSKLYHYYKSDKHFLLTLGTGKLDSIEGNYNDHFDPSTGEWFIQKKTGSNEILLNNLANKRQISIEGNDYQLFAFSKRKDVLLLKREMKGASNKTIKLSLVYLKTGSTSTVWEGTNCDNIVLDDYRIQFSFLSKKQGINNELWLYKDGNSAAFIQRINLDDRTKIKAINRFSNDGCRIFVRLTENRTFQTPNQNAVNVDIWSYKDSTSMSRQKLNSREKEYDGVIDIQNNRLVNYISSEYSSALSRYAKNGNYNDEWTVFQKWSLVPGLLSSYESGLFSTTGNKILMINKHGVSLSPDGKYAIYFDDTAKNFFVYEVATGITSNITKRINTIWANNVEDDRIKRASVAGWIANDEAVLLYDQFDIWEVNLNDSKPAVNLTNGLGRRDSTLFYLALDQYSKTAISKNEQIIINGFNRVTKDNGFYTKRFSDSGDPIKLTMGPYVYDVTDNPEVEDGAHFTPIKAKNANVYIIKKQSANEFPNLYLTTDFRKYLRLTNLKPESEYNWYTSELLEWQIPGGPKSQGILYKPQNFDASKKYPVIFYYYQRLSDNLNVYLMPTQSTGALNIPWYVSNGYLVFTPDIHYKLQNAGDWTVASITSAAGYLSKLDYVDEKKMGIQGISWGGYQTNYIVTHTGIFAAACSASGASDFISYAGSLGGGGTFCQDFFESQLYYKTNLTLWERPDVWIKNSPIFSANKVSTPFLMMATTIDGAVPFSQALEFHNALRRLGKKTWLLEYNDTEHGVWGKASEDFDLRMRQFFNHYLKDASPPKWMTQGRPAYLKGIDNRLELDMTGVKP